MATVVDAGDDYRTPVVSERLVLLQVDGGAAPQELYFMLLRLRDATWLLGDVNGSASEVDLQEHRLQFMLQERV